MRGRFYTPRESLIRKGSIKITSKKAEAVAYTYEVAGKFYGLVFFGKQSKPAGHYSFRTIEKRAEWIGQMFASRIASQAYKAEYTAKRKAWVPNYKVGQIFKTCWGYDQTNVEYFEIIEIKGKMAVLREIAQERKETHSMRGTCVPLPGEYIGKPITKLMQEHGFKISSCSTATLVKATMVGTIPVYSPSHWSSYA